MSRLRRGVFRLMSVFRRERIDAEMTEEIRLHLEMQKEANIAAGMNAEEAAYAARRAFGGVDQVMERYRDEHGIRWLDEGLRDLRHAARGLLREKAFTATVLAIIALCVAANVAIFFIVNEILLRPLPFADAAGILTVYDEYPKAGVKGGVSVPHYVERRQQVSAFAEMGAWRDGGVTLGGIESKNRVEAMFTTASFLPVLRARPALGRTFAADEDKAGHSSVAIISDDLWRGLYNSDPAIIGKTILIENFPYVVIGVMQPNFRYLSRRPMLIVPLELTDYEKQDGMRHANSLEVIARLRDGATLAQAQSQLDEVNRRTLKQDPYAKTVEEAGFRSVVRGLHSEFVSEIRPVLLLLQTGAAFLMLIGAVNLANLLVVRSTGKAKEYSVRRALGAGSFRLGRYLLIETLLLSIAGAAVGLAAGTAVVRITLSSFSNRLPFEVHPGLNGTVLVATLSASALFGVLLAVPVLWHSLHNDLAESLSSESRTGTTTKGVHRLRHTLIAAQIALAFVLLAGTGLLGASLMRLLAVDPGFRKENVLTGMILLPTNRYPDEKHRLEFVDRLTRELRALPGVTAVGIDTMLPFTWDNGNMINFKAHVLAPGEAARPHQVSTVAGDLFTALGIPLVKGRFIDGDDIRAGRMVCVVDEDFASRYWPDGDAIGHGITNDMAPNAVFFTIVGIVGAVKQTDLADQRANGAVYLPYTGSGNPMLMLALHASQDTASLGPSLLASVARLDKELTVADLMTMQERVDHSLAGRRLSLALASVFAGISLVLAALGIYGVLAYAVAQRRREIGVRMALGARPEQILLQFLRLGAGILAVSLPLGCAGALLVTRAMTGFLYGVGPANLTVLGVTAATLGFVAMLACLIPAQRGAQVSPAEALRHS